MVLSPRLVVANEADISADGGGTDLAPICTPAAGQAPRLALEFAADSGRAYVFLQSDSILSTTSGRHKWAEYYGKLANTG